MASKSKTKTKIKLKRKEFVVEGKIIDLQRFAFDIFAHSAAKFGVPDGCIVKLQEGENDYGFPDFIVVLSRFLFRCQVKGRNIWYTHFKPYYESTKFKSFESIQNALRQVLSDTVKYDRNLVSHEAIITLALISELVLFLYAENCLLYLQELGNFWSECWCFRKKEFEKSGGLVGLYHSFNNPDETKVDIFFNEFIPVYCIPYDGSRELQDVFNEEFKKFFKLTEEKIDAMEKEIRETAAGKDALVRELASQLSIAHEAAQKPRRTLRVNKTPRNPGLGIRKHEDLLRDVLGTDTKTSSSVQSKSDQKTARYRGGSSTQKESRTKKSSLGKMLASPEQSHTVVLGAAAASSHDEESDNETFGNTGLGIRTHEDLRRDVFGTNIVSPEEAASSSRQKTAKDRKKSAKKNQKKISSPLSNMAVSQPLETGLIRAEAALKTLDVESEKEAIRNIVLGFQPRDELMRHVFGFKTASSPDDLSSKHHQKTAKDRRGSSTIKESRTKKTSLGKMVSSPEQSPTAVLRAEALSFLDEESDNETFVNTGLGIRTHEDLLRDVFGTNIVSPEEATSSSRQKTTKDPRVSASKKKNQKKISSPSSTVASPESLQTGFLGLDSATTCQNLPGSSRQTTAQDLGASVRQKTSQKTKTKSRSNLEDIDPSLELPRGLPEAPLDEDAVEIEGNTGLDLQTHDNWFGEMIDAEIDVACNDISRKIHQKIASDRKKSDTKKKNLKKITSQSLTVEGSGHLKTRQLETGFATSSQYLSSESRQETEMEEIGSSSQRERRKKVSSPSSSKEVHERLETSPLGAEAASSSKKREDSGNDEYIGDFGMTDRELLSLMGIRKRVSSDSD